MDEQQSRTPPAGEETGLPQQSPVPTPTRPAQGMAANTWAMIAHLSALTGYIFPVVGNIVGPLVVWIIKKDEMPEVERHGKAALNFQISFLIYIAVANAVAFALTFVLIGFLLMPLVWVASVIVLVLFPVLAGLKANEGGWYEYPWTIQFLK
jgi:uncharacterized Tic20 family protein